MYPTIGVYCVDETRVNFIKILNEHGFKVIALCGDDLDSLNKIASEFKIDIITQKVEDLLLNRDLNMIIFFKNIPEFCELVCKSLTVAGKHVMCYEGFSVSFAHASEMYDASLKYESLASLVINPLRFGKNVLIAQTLVETRSVGKILYIDVELVSSSIWFDSPSYTYDTNWGGGLFQKYGIFIIDIICTILSSNIAKIFCKFSTMVCYPNKSKPLQRNNSDDYFNFSAELEDGTPLCIQGRVNHKLDYEYYNHKIRLVFDNGEIILNNDALQLNLQSVDVDIDPLLSSNPDKPTIFTYPPLDADYLDLLVGELEMVFTGGKYNPNKDMIDKILTFNRGIHLSKIVDSAFESNKNGVYIHIKEPKIHSFINNEDSSPLPPFTYAQK